MRLVNGIIHKYFKLFVSIVLVSSLGCAIMTGLSSGHLSLVDSLDNYINDGQYPEAIVTSEVINRNIINEINKLSEVEKAEGRLTGDTFVISEGGRLFSCSLFSFRDDDRQKFYYWDYIEPEDDDHVYIDYIFAQGNNIKAGDYLKIKIGEEYRVYQVAGIISMPQTLAIETHGNRWNTNSDFGYIFASKSLLEKETEKRKNEEKIAIDNKKEALKENQDKVLEYIDDVQGQLSIAEDELNNAKKLYSYYSDGYRQYEAKLLETYELLDFYQTQISDQRIYLEKAYADITSLINQSKESLESLKQASSALKEIAAIEKEIEEVNRELSNAYEFLSVLEQLGNYRLSDVFNAVKTFNDLLSFCMQHGFYYDVSEDVEQLSTSILDFIAERKDDLLYLTGNDTQQLIQRIINEEEGIKDTDEYVFLKNKLSEYEDVYDDNIVDAYLRVTDSLSVFAAYVDSYNVRELLDFLNNFASSSSLSDLLTRISKIEELLPLISKYSGFEIETTHDLCVGFDITKEKVVEISDEVNRQKETIIAELTKQGINIEDIPDLIRELEETIDLAPDLLEEISSAFIEIDNGLSLINEYRKTIEETINSFNEVENTYKETLNDAQRKYEAGKNDFNLLKAEYLKQFGQLHEEIEKAYIRLDESEGYEDLANQFMIYFKKGVDQKSAIEKINKIIENKGDIKDSYVYENSPVKGRIDANIAPLETMSYFVPMVFFAIVMLVVFMFMSLIIRQCRREIGILRALGFSNLKVTGIFCLINLISSLIACFVGLFMGKLASMIIGNIYASFFPLPIFTYELDYRMYIFAALVTIIVSEAATVLSALPITSIEPSEAMSRDVGDNKELPVSLKRLVRRSSPINKFSILSLLRNPLKFIFSVLCIASTIVLIFVSLSIFASTDYLLGSYYGKQIKYDVEMYFMKQPDQEYIRQLEDLNYVDNVEKISYYYANIKVNDKSKDIVIKALEKDSDLIVMFDKLGNRLNLNEDGIIIDQTIANELGVKKGDEVMIDNKSLKVSAVAEQTLNFYSYLSLNQEVLKDPDLYTLICKVDPDSEEELLRYLAKNDDYLYSVFSDVSYVSLERALRIYDGVVRMIIAFAMIIGLIIVLNTALTNILEKKRELSVLRTLGFQHHDISRSWFSQSLLFFISSCFIGIPAGIKITRICLEKLSTNGRLYVFVSGIKEYLLSMAFVLIYICLAHFLTMNSFKKWDYIENVKDKE